MDLERLSARELDTLISKAKKRKMTLGKRKPVAVVRRKVAALAKAEGYSIEELFGTAKAATASRKPAAPRAGKAGSKVAPKYRNPANPKETWSGRGQLPRWMAAEVARGRKREDFLIE